MALKRAKKQTKKPEPRLLNTFVDTLPHGKHENVTLVIPYGRNAHRGRFAVVDGQIYTLDRSPFDLADEGRMGLNDNVRRVWCNLAGVKMADLQATIKIKREQTRAELQSDEIRRLSRRAASKGYRLIKVAP